MRAALERDRYSRAAAYRRTTQAYGPHPLPARPLPPVRPRARGTRRRTCAGIRERVHRWRRRAGGALWPARAGVARRGARHRTRLAVRRHAGRSFPGPLAAHFFAGRNNTFVLIAIASGISPVSAQSPPPPTPKSSRFTVALPTSTGFAPGVQVNSRVTGLLVFRRDSV